MSLLAPGRNFPSLRSMLPHTETKFYGAGAAVCHLCGSSAIRKLTELRKAWKSGKNTTWISRGYAFWYIPVDSAAYTLFNILYSYTWFILLYNHILRICLFLLLITRDICNSLWKIASFTVTSLARPLPRQGNIEQVGSGWRKWLLALPEPAWKWTWIIPVLFFFQNFFQTCGFSYAFPLPECFGELLEQWFVVASFLKQALRGTPWDSNSKSDRSVDFVTRKGRAEQPDVESVRGSRRFKPPVTGTAI